MFTLSTEHTVLFNTYQNVYSGNIIYQQRQLIDLYNNINDNDQIGKALWGMITINSLWSIMIDNTQEIQELYDRIKDIYNSNKKISLVKSDSETLYYVGRFNFELMGFLRSYKIPKLSSYNAYLQYTEFFQAVITKNQNYTDEAKIMLAIGFSYPALDSTNNWNTLVLSYIGNNSSDSTLKYQSYLAQTRVYIKTNRIAKAKEMIQNAKNIFPNNPQAILMEINLR
ncbi:MAG: hypothetical protein ACRC0X_00115 [Brevinema sp.]